MYRSATRRCVLRVCRYSRSRRRLRTINATKGAERSSPFAALFFLISHLSLIRNALSSCRRDIHNVTEPAGVLQGADCWSRNIPGKTRRRVYVAHSDFHFCRTPSGPEREGGSVLLVRDGAFARNRRFGSFDLYFHTP